MLENYLKVSLSPVTFNHFLRKVIRYCDPNRMQELDIKMHHHDQLSYEFELFEQMRPFLGNLQQFKLNNRLRNQLVPFNRSRLDSVFAYYQNDINTIKLLTIDGCQFFHQVVSQMDELPNALPNITELRISSVDLSHYFTQFRRVLSKLPNLEKFICATYYPHVAADVGKELTSRFPKLKSFGYITHRFYCSEEDQTENNEFNILQSFSFLRQFHNLTELEMGTDCDCKNVFQILRYCPNIRTFSIWQIDHMFQESVEIRRIVQAIKQIIVGRRIRFPLNDYVVIVVNHRQYREFKAIKRIGHFVRLSLMEVPQRSIVNVRF